MLHRRSVLNLAFFIYKESEYWVGQHYLREKIRALTEELFAEFVLWENSNPKIVHATKIEELIKEIKEVLLQARSRDLLNRENFQLISQELKKIKKEVLQDKSEIAFDEKLSHTYTRTRDRKPDIQTELSQVQKKILQLLQERGPLQVAGLQPYFPHLTKRTIRRHLRFLVEKGLIQREGEGSNVIYKSL